MGAPAGDRISVAFDVGPLVGLRTGVGAAVAALHRELAGDPGVRLLPYRTSFRARAEAGVRRLPVPAAAAHRVWARSDLVRLDRWVRGADVVHATNYVVPPSRLPRLVSVYDCWFLSHPELAHPDVVRAGRVLRRSLRRGAVAHASSHATADALREHCPGADVRVVHLAPLELPAPDPAGAAAPSPLPELGQRPFVLATGTLERRKNLPHLVRAFGAVAHRVPELQLVIAGPDGDDRAGIDAAVDAIGSEAAGRVLLTGWVDDGVRAWLLRHARLLAYPSLDEGFGFPLLDAMQADLPVVASTAGSIPEVAGDAAVLVDPGDVDALAAALERVAQDEELRAGLVRAGRARLGRFSWADTAVAVRGLYRELAGGGPA